MITYIISNLILPESILFVIKSLAFIVEKKLYYEVKNVIY